MSLFGDKIRDALNQFETDSAKFEAGNASAGVRARKALMEMKKLVAEEKKAMSPSKLPVKRAA